MKTLGTTLLFAIGMLGAASSANAAVEYVKICSLYGAGFNYLPGTDICLNAATGETRQETEGGVWTSLSHTRNQGQWAAIPQTECSRGRLVKVGTVRPSDFQLNTFATYEAPAVPLKLERGEFISKVMFSGGIMHPLQISAKTSQVTTNQFCLRVSDPTYTAIDLGVVSHPKFCGAPLACVSNQQILGTPAAYSIPVLGTPIVHYDTDSNGKVIGTPSTCGSQVVLTTGMGRYNPKTIPDPVNPEGLAIPTIGTVSTWVCVERGDVMDAR